MVVESLDTPAPSTSRFRDAIHPVQFGIFPNRLLLPHPDDEMLSGYEEDVSSIRDGYTVWVKVDLVCILERHLVISNSAKPIFREAQDRRKTRLNCHRKPHRGKTAHHRPAKGNRVPPARLLVESFSRDPFAGCAILLNKDTFHPDIKVSSIHLHDTRNVQHQVINEGQSGWVSQAVISRASFQRLPRNGKSFFTMMSLHINHFVKKAWYRKETVTYSPYCNVTRTC